MPSYISELIDRVLEEDDANNDGYLSYAEYKISRRKNVEDDRPAVNMIP